MAGKARLGQARKARRGKAGREINTMTYKWGTRYQLNGPSGADSAQRVGERLAAIKAKAGTITPVIVVDDARDKDSDLHPFFEWNDGKAAEEWRRQQARMLIGSIKVVVEGTSTDKDPISVRAFIHISDEDIKGSDRYEPLAVVLSDRALYAQVCARALDDLRGFQRRYSQFSTLTTVATRAIDEVAVSLRARSF